MRMYRISREVVINKKKPFEKEGNKTKQSAINLEDIIALLPGHIYWKDKKGVLLGCNDQQAQDIGLKSRNEIVGLTAHDTLPKELADQVTRTDREVMESGKPQMLEEALILDDGTKSIWLSKKIPLRGKNGEVIGLVGISLDITDQKHAEEREKKALLKAAEAAKEKAQLEENLRLAVTVVAGRIAHDIRTPLNILLRKSENLKDIMPIVLEVCKKAEESGLDIEGISSREYDYLQTIPDAVENEIGKLNQFISSVLKTLSKTVKGEISREDLEICWIHGIIGRALIEYPYADDEERSLIEYKRGANFTFLGNDILLIYAFYNLIKNSLYQIEKNKKGKIYITTEIGEEANVVRFKDTAGGASPEIIKQFFSGYKTNKQEGTGLGLASIKQTMQLFGGDVVCNSEEGNFLEFIFTFPKLEK